MSDVYVMISFPASRRNVVVFLNLLKNIKFTGLVFPLSVSACVTWPHRESEEVRLVLSPLLLVVFVCRCETSGITGLCHRHEKCYGKNELFTPCCQDRRESMLSALLTYLLSYSAPLHSFPPGISRLNYCPCWQKPRTPPLNLVNNYLIG